MFSLMHQSVPLPLAIATGSFWPADTIQSIAVLQDLGLLDIELTLQANEFRLGFDRSLQMSLYPTLIDMVQRNTLRICSIHAPHMDAEHGHSMGARLEYLRQTLETARSLGAQILVAHPFHLFSSYEAAISFLRGSTNIEEAILPGFRSILDQASLYGIVISLENVKIWFDDEGDYFNEPNNMLRLVTSLYHPAFGITLDIVHASLIGNLNTFLERLDKHIVNLHLADVVSPAKRVPLGEGIIDWGNLIPALEQLPNLRQVTVELSAASPDEVSRAARALQSFWNRDG